MRQDIILKPWQIELTTNSTNDSFEESTFFTGNGRMGIRGYLPFWQEKRQVCSLPASSVKSNPASPIL